MLIYHNSGIGTASNIFNNTKKNLQKQKKNYKSSGNRKPMPIHTKVLEQEDQKKKVRKKLTKKNKQFLEGLGLKVKR